MHVFCFFFFAGFLRHAYTHAFFVFCFPSRKILPPSPLFPVVRVRKGKHVAGSTGLANAKL